MFWQTKHKDCTLKKFLKDSFSFVYGSHLETVLSELGPVRKPPLATKNLLEDTDGLRRPP